MAGRAVVIDTNILPVYGGLDGPLWLSVRKLCEVANVDVIIPELVVHESANLRRTRYAVASTDFLSKYSEVSKYVELEPVYVPDAEEVSEVWSAELRAVFSVREIDTEDAVEALEREALRRRPARNGRGARDSAIWLMVLRLAAAYDAVFFVSANTADFGAGKRGGLHPDLASEEASARGRIEYLTDIRQLIETLATRTKVDSIDLVGLAELLRLDVRQNLVAIADAGKGFAGIESTPIDAIVFEGARILQGYLVDDRTLALVEVSGHLELEASEPVGFLSRAWIDVNPLDGSPIAGEIYDAFPS